MIFPVSNHEYLDENMSTKLIKYYEDNHEFVSRPWKKGYSIFIFINYPNKNFLIL